MGKHVRYYFDKEHELYKKCSVVLHTDPTSGSDYSFPFNSFLPVLVQKIGESSDISKCRRQKQRGKIIVLMTG